MCRWDAAQRLAWLTVVMLCDRVPPAALKIAVALADHYNTDTGRCDPSLRTLARRTGLTQQSAKKARQALRLAGFVEYSTDGGDPAKSARANHTLLWPETLDNPRSHQADGREGGMYVPPCSEGGGIKRSREGGMYVPP